MAGAMRFSTVELGELEARIASAADRALRIELGIFDDLAAAGLAEARAASRRRPTALAALDVAAALAELAASEGWTRPVVDDSARLRIEGGRHPVVEAALEARRQRLHRQRLRSLLPARPRRRRASGWSPARTWPASRPSCARTR